jgi:hypothetical protein
LLHNTINQCLNSRPKPTFLAGVLTAIGNSWGRNKINLILLVSLQMMNTQKNNFRKSINWFTVKNTKNKEVTHEKHKVNNYFLSIGLRIDNKPSARLK